MTDPDAPIVVGVLRGRTANVARVGGAVLGGGLALLSLLALLLGPVAFVGTSPLILATVFTSLWAMGRARKLVREGALSVDERVVRVGGVELVRRDRIKSAVVVPASRDGALVRLHTGTWPIDLRVPDVAAGRAVLTRLGLDAGHATAEFSVLSADPEGLKKKTRLGLASLPIPILLMFFGGITRTWPLLGLGFAAFVAFIFTMASLSVPKTVVAGSDGLLVRGLFRREFIPLDTIAGVEVLKTDFMMNTEAVILRLHRPDGTNARDLVISGLKQGPFQEGIHAEIEARAHALAERIREALELRDLGRGSAEARSLARSARPFDEWVEALRVLPEKAVGFRAEQPLGEDALLAIVEDRTSPAWKRAAAAAALSAREEAVRARVRIAAASVAAPQLRVAMETAADGDAARVADALESLEMAERTERSSPK